MARARPKSSPIVMAYIPEKHQKYNLLPRCREHGGEVFEYPGYLHDMINLLLPDGESVNPYGYDSYEEYYAEIDRCRDLYASTDKAKALFDQYKVVMKEMNRKENWSVLKYVGNSNHAGIGVTKGHVYYWPCSKFSPVYQGVIDDEEYTSYAYSTNPDDWESLEDSTGMAFRTIYKKTMHHRLPARSGFERTLYNIIQELIFTPEE